MDFTIKGFQQRITDADYRDSIMKYWKKHMKVLIEQYIIDNNLAVTTTLKYNPSYPITKGDIMELNKKIPVDKRTQDIHRQVFIKIASEQIKGTPAELLSYAKSLEEVFDGWD